MADPVVVRVGGAGSWTIPDKNAPDPRSRADRAVIDAFEHEHPSIQLVNANGLQITGQASESNLLMAFAGGTAPDVVYVNFRSMNNYIQQGFLMPLDSYLAASPGVIKRVNPTIRSVITVDGHVYAVPYAQVVQALYYRRDLFQQAGIDPDQPPQTWQQFYDDCARITDHKKGVWGFEWPPDAGDTAYWWINLLWQAGGDVTKRNDKGQWVAAFDTPQGATALEFYKHLVADSYVSPIDGKNYVGVAKPMASDYSADRARNKVAMWFAYQSNVIANTSDASALNPSLIGIAPMPAGPAGSANEINAAMWAISSQIKDHKVRDAAWAFIKFMASDEADEIRTKAYVDAGLGYLINPVSLEKYGYGDEVTAQGRVWLKTSRTLFTHGHPEPYGANMQAVYDFLGYPIQEITLRPDANPNALLSYAARQIDDRLIGYTPPAVLARRRLIAWSVFVVVVLGGVALSALWTARYVLRARAQNQLRASSSVTSAHNSRDLRLAVVAWIFMLPAVLSVLVWSYFPLVRGLALAFQDYRIVAGARYAGLDNFIDVALSPTFWIGLGTAAQFTVYSLLIGFFLPIILAIMLSEIPHGTVVYRTLYYLPAMTASLVTMFVWKWIEDSGPTGLFNTALGHVGIAPQSWLGDPKWAMLAVVVPQVWASAGPGCIIYLAALKAIPQEMYEAADLDGAGILVKVRHLTIPTLWPLMLINLVGATIGSFKATEAMFVMTGGGPLYATHTIGLDIFYNAFVYLKFGFATAEAWIMGSLLIGFTLFQLRMMRNLKFSAAR
jgi:multiple sugar transport system permease protein